ncbi:hypothetical protein VNO77_19374 [Canavalia gladiata]|uniref:Uncharacterized protein n=1 Tax=Canavalia gladiata TaxID=3824 RepID=A0AAN9LML2_CANGL
MSPSLLPCHDSSIAEPLRPNLFSPHTRVQSSRCDHTHPLCTITLSDGSPGVCNCLRPLDRVWGALEKVLLASVNSLAETPKSAGRAKTKSAGSRRGTDDSG